MSKQTKAAATSFLRVLAATFGAAVLMAWDGFADHDVGSWTWSTLGAFGAAVASAFMLSVVNWLRSGETRFGVGADGGPDSHEG